jgi:DNA-binding NtrC family response regulator
LFDHTHWVLLEAHSCREALSVLRRHDIPVVITEPALPDGSWKDLLPLAESRRGRHCLIVASRLADERMWMEVLDLGGFNVLEKPFDKRELFRLISLAWLQWREQSRSVHQATAAAG